MAARPLTCTSSQPQRPSEVSLQVRGFEEFPMDSAQPSPLKDTQEDLSQTHTV